MIKTRSYLKRHCYLTTVRTNDQISIFLTQKSLWSEQDVIWSDVLQILLGLYLTIIYNRPFFPLYWSMHSVTILTGVPKDNLFFFQNDYNYYLPCIHPVQNACHQRWNLFLHYFDLGGPVMPFGQYNGVEVARANVEPRPLDSLACCCFCPENLALPKNKPDWACLRMRDQATEWKVIPTPIPRCDSPIKTNKATYSASLIHSWPKVHKQTQARSEKLITELSLNFWAEIALGK